MSPLEKIIAPCSLRDFTNDFWDREVLYLERNDQDYYKTFFSSNQVKNLFSSNDVFYPLIRVVNGGASVPVEQYTKQLTNNFNIQVCPELLRKLFLNGCTIVAQYLKLRYDSLWEFCSSIENDLGGEVCANGYLTPPNSKGFRLHYDSHNVFILQLVGEKKWMVYDEMAKWPLSNAHQPENNSPKLKYHFSLKPGDFLYIPRGMGHEASTNDLTSFHLTISLFPSLRIDLLRSAVSDTNVTELLKYRPDTYNSNDLQRDYLNVVERILLNVKNFSFLSKEHPHRDFTNLKK